MGKKFDIDGDGAFSLREAYISEAGAALEEQEEEDMQKKFEELQEKKEKQERRIKERLKRRQKNQKNKVAEKEIENLKVGDAVEVRMGPDANPMQGTIKIFENNTYEVTLRGGEGVIN